MIVLPIFFLIIFIANFRFGYAKLNALDNSPFTVELYIKLHNGDRPPQTDPAVSSAAARMQICEDIFYSGFFSGNFTLYDLNDSNSFHEICNSFPNLNLENTNSFKEMVFTHLGRHVFYEHTFLCPLKNWSSNKIHLIHVSKEYNVSSLEQHHKPGRFVVGTNLRGFLPISNLLILAEEPMFAYTSSNLDVEFRYLQTRRHMEPASSNAIDPLCKWISDDMFFDSKNQHYRFCVALSRSPQFENEVEYPDGVTNDCYVKKISFRTALVNGSEETYSERMTKCSFDFLNEQENKNSSIFISRAYLSNAVFVYRGEDSLNGKIYLENLSTNVSISDELNSFDFVEY